MADTRGRESGIRVPLQLLIPLQDGVVSAKAALGFYQRFKHRDKRLKTYADFYHEPLNELGVAIQDRSPFPHTLVLGYANGRGATYVGLPGKKWKGGYEMSHVGTGGDEVGQSMVDSAIRLLKEHAGLAHGR